MAKVLHSRMKAHLLRLTCIPALARCERTSFKLSKCSAFVLTVTRMSSIYTVTPGIPCNMVSIARWNIAGAEAMLKGRRLYW